MFGGVIVGLLEGGMINSRSNHVQYAFNTMVNAISHHSHPRSIHSQSMVNATTTRNNAITAAEGGFKGCESGVWVKKSHSRPRT